jgi:hypothetical protein
MRLRLISDEQVERIIAEPTRSAPSTNPPGRIVAERVTAAGNTLRVVFVERPTAGGIEAFVLTVVWIGGQGS